MIEFISSITLWSLVVTSVVMFYDAVVVDTEEELTAKHRHNIKHIYIKVTSMSIKELRSFLDNTGQHHGIIKVYENIGDIKIGFDMYDFTFSLDENSYDCYVSINNITLNMTETFDNYKNKFTIDYFNDILNYHHFDKLLVEDTIRHRNGIFL